MPIDTQDAKHPGESAGPKHCIFQEIGPRGGKTKHFIAVPAGRRLPQTQKAGNLWKPWSIHELHAGIS